MLFRSSELQFRQFGLPAIPGALRGAIGGAQLVPPSE
jgi:hypothetical protein